MIRLPGTVLIPRDPEAPLSAAERLALQGRWVEAVSRERPAPAAKGICLVERLSSVGVIIAIVILILAIVLMVVGQLPILLGGLLAGLALAVILK